MCKHRMSIAGCPLNLENDSPLSGTVLYNQTWYIGLPKLHGAVARKREPRSFVQPKKTTLIPRPIVHNPRQNYHGWWGTLTVAEDENGVQSNHGLQLDSKDPNCLHVFVKTSSDLHFVAQGIELENLRLLGTSASEAMTQLKGINEEENLGLQDVLELIGDDLNKIQRKGDVRIYMPRGINYAASTPLSRVLSITTEVCFNNDSWLENAGEIGQRNIELG